jgi:hypothetical protein
MQECSPAKHKKYVVNLCELALQARLWQSHRQENYSITKQSLKVISSTAEKLGTFVNTVVHSFSISSSAEAQ